MGETISPKVGEFCWVELMTSDTAGAKKFYGALLGWSFHDDPVPGHGVYTMLGLGDGHVGGMFELNEEMKSHGIPPHWASYVMVDDADATAGKVAGLGGQVLRDPFDVMEIGRMAVVQDPTGGTFSLWQAKTHTGATLAKNTVGMFCWNELLSTDAPAATTFYTELLGWTAKMQDMGGFEYCLLKNGETDVGGLMPMPKQMEGTPTCWWVYFVVEDCDARLAQAGELGGRALSEPVDIPNVGRMAPLMDPQGACCSLIKLAEH